MKKFNGKIRTIFFVLIYSAAVLSCRMEDMKPGGVELMDVHGAGAQRSDPKAGDPADYPEGHGPQGDVIRIYNHVRLVRGNSSSAHSYPVVDTGQTVFYDNNLTLTSPPSPADPFFGQDAHIAGLQPSYTNNGDGTVADNNTGLIWQRSPDRNGDGRIDASDKLTYQQALSGAASVTTAGHSDWRLPTIKELYSLIVFSGEDPSGFDGTDTSGLKPFIDTAYFNFGYGDISAGERIIDAQYASSTLYVGKTMNGDDTMFGVNFADGRIKGYGLSLHGSEKTFYVIYVRNKPDYGKNSFSEAGGIVTDAATGLQWDRDDSGTGLNWSEALEWVKAKNAENYKGHSDWRLPDTKELQSIVDYTRSPSITDSAAIDPLFNCSSITDEGGNQNFSFYWTGTTHAGPDGRGASAAYVAFGEALGFMSMGMPPQ